MNDVTQQPAHDHRVIGLPDIAAIDDTPRSGIERAAGRLENDIR